MDKLIVLVNAASLFFTPVVYSDYVPRPNVEAKIIAAAASKIEPVEPPAPEPEHHHHPVIAPSLADIARRVASCESGDGRGSYSLTAKNPVSTASGKYQFINGTWESVTGLPAPASAYSEEIQDAAFYKLWNNGKGSFHWNASRSCWS